ncbi:MAG TPA: CAP domain-containing protein [Thermoanaerobaculia bacterium]|nr:CAP domain-containing protein [Thermoanaerobaculia bacterium]
MIGKWQTAGLGVFLGIVLATSSAFAACKFNPGDLVAYQEGAAGDSPSQSGSVAWRESRVFGQVMQGGNCFYKITGPGGLSDVTNAQLNVPESRLLSLADARGQGLVPPASTAQVSPTIVDPARINIAQLEKDLFNATNSARTAPSGFADKIVQNVQGTYTYPKNANQLWVTPPGESTMGYDRPGQETAYKAAVTQAITWLQGKDPASKPGTLTAYTWSEGLARAARKHASDPNISGHTGGDGSTPFMRMALYGTGGSGENLSANQTTGLGYAYSFIIDYNVPDLGHRKNIFSSSNTHLGVGCHYFAPSDPQDYGYIRCVMNFGINYKEYPPVGVVANFDDNSVTLFDTTSNKVTTKLTGVGTGPLAVARQRYDKKAFVVSTDKLSLIDTQQNRLVSSWSLPNVQNKAVRGKALAVSPKGDEVYVGAWQAGETGTQGKGYVLKFKADGTFEKSVAAGVNPISLSVSRNGRRLYVGDGNGPGFYLDLTDNDKRYELPVNGTMVESEDGTLLFGAGTLQVWRVTVGTWQPTILDSLPMSSGQVFLGAALGPQSRYLYAVSFNLQNTTGEVVEIDTASGAVQKRLTLPGQGWQVASSVDGKGIFVTNRIDQVYAIDDQWRLTKIPLAKGPTGIAIVP